MRSPSQQPDVRRIHRAAPIPPLRLRASVRWRSLGPKVASSRQQQLKFAPPASVLHSRLRSQRSPEAANNLYVDAPLSSNPNSRLRSQRSPKAAPNHYFDVFQVSNPHSRLRSQRFPAAANKLHPHSKRSRQKAPQTTKQNGDLGSVVGEGRVLLGVVGNAENDRKCNAVVWFFTCSPSAPLREGGGGWKSLVKRYSLLKSCNSFETPALALEGHRGGFCRQYCTLLL